jgi:hypothetical protein
MSSNSRRQAPTPELPQQRGVHHPTESDRPVLAAEHDKRQPTASPAAE